MKKQITFLRTVLLVAVMLWGVMGSTYATIYTVSASGTNSGTSWTTIAGAYGAIPATPSSGGDIIELQSDYNPASESYPITLGAKSGADATHGITIRPAIGVKKIIGPANQTVIATVIGSTFTTNASATLDVNLTGIISNGSFGQIAVDNYISGIGTYKDGTFKKVTAINAGTNTITAAIGAFTASSIAGNKLFIGPAQTRAFYFNGAKYVTIDGVSRTGTTGLTIQNPNCIYAQTILFGGSSHHNTIKNCIIRGANQTGAWNNGWDGTIYFAGATYTTIANNDICDMGDTNIPYPISAIQMTSAGGTNSNQTITNNNIYNISNLYSENGNYGFLVFGSDANSTNHNITYNRFYWTNPTVFKGSAINFLAFATIGSGHRFEGNVFGYGSADGSGTSTLTFNGSGTTYGFAGLKNAVFKNNIFGGITINGTGFVAMQLVRSTAGTVSADSLCYGNQVKDISVNCAVNGSLYGILINEALVSNINVKNNVIKDLTVSSSTGTVTNTIYGVSHNFAGNLFSINVTTTTSSTAATITAGALVSGVTYSITGNTSITSGTTFTYSGSNSITLSAAALSAATGKATTATGTTSLYINCIGNEISNLTAGNSGCSVNNSITAFMSGGCSNTYEKNLVYNLNTISTGTGSVIKGLRFATSKASGITVKNNIIRLGTDVSSDAEISAIIDEGLSSNGHPLNIYHNSIYIGGTSQTKSSHCFNHSTGANYGLITLKNNIFSNKRSGGSAVNQIYNMMAAAEISNTEYNLYEYSTKFGTVTTTSPTTYTEMSDWVTAKSPTVVETGSINQTSPQFMDATATIPDLRIIASSAVVDQVGADLSATVADDYDGKTRSSFTAHDLGAFAYTKVASVSDASLASHRFRTQASGDWRTNATWESSSDGNTWITATAFPSATANSIVIQNGHTVTATAEATASTLTVNGGGKLTLSDRFGLSATNLNLESHASNGTATFVDGNSTGGLTVSGTTTVKQNLTSGRNWYISNPVVATTLPTVASGTRTLYGYNEAIVNEPTGSSGWVANPASVEVGKGYVASVSVTGDLTFTGALNTGNKDITLTSRTGTANKAGFNLIGNPYPSYLDWDAVMAANTDKLRSTTMWYRTKLENAQHEMVYSFWTVNGDGVGVPNNASVKIPPMQSFWVRAIEGGATINLTNAMRSHAPETDKLLKAPAAKNTDRTLVRLQVSNGINSDETVIYFSEKAKDGFDSNDAPKMSNGNAAIPEIFTSLDNEKIIINCMNTMPLNQEIGLGFAAGNASSFSLKANEITNLPENVKVILKDNAANIETDLSDGTTTYAFEPIATQSDRFSLIFRTAGSTTDVQKPKVAAAQVFVNGNNQICIIAPLKSNYAIYNDLGQLIENGIQNTERETRNTKLATGVYVVKVNNQSNRVIIK